MLPSAARAAARARAPLARAFTRAAAPAAPAPPLLARRRSALFPRDPLVFFVQRAGGADWAEVAVAPGASVAALKKAALAELRLDAPPDAVELALAARAAGAPPLDATQTLEEALAAGALTTRAKLVVAVRAPPPPAALSFFIQRAAGGGFVEIKVAAGATTTELTEAAIAKLNLDVLPDTVSLSPAAGGAPLDATLPLADALAAAGLALRAKLLVTVHTPLMLPFRVRGLGGEDEVGLQPLSSEAEFATFVSGHTMWAVYEQDGGGSWRSKISTLRAARNALATPGACLILRDVGDVVAADVSNLKRAAKNASTSFEALSNKAAAADTGLRARYGTLEVVNKGEEVVFFETRTGNCFASFDGLFFSERGSVIFNEAKASLHPADVVAVRTAAARLADVARDPARFFSRPSDVVLRVAGRAVVPLLSSAVCDAATAAAAAAARVHVLVKTGAGFACALAEGEFEAAAADATTAS